MLPGVRPLSLFRQGRIRSGSGPEGPVPRADRCVRQAPSAGRNPENRLRAGPFARE